MNAADWTFGCELCAAAPCVKGRAARETLAVLHGHADVARIVSWRELNGLENPYDEGAVPPPPINST